MRQFLELDYWGRMWIVQEMALSRECVFMIGTTFLPWLSLITPFFALKAFRVRTIPRPDFIPPPAWKIFTSTQTYLDWETANLADLLKRDMEDNAVRPLSYYLRRTHQLSARNPRDKIFALFGIVKIDMDIGE